jgi:Xaa-Pro aminopeptidase
VKDAEVDGNRTLLWSTNGKREPLTIGKIKSFLGHDLLDKGFASEEMIVACGPKGADPHYLGNPEDKIKADQPIILDIYPTSIHKRYSTDMTRTIVKGKASSEIRRMFETVLDARNVSIDELKAGVTGREVYNECCNVMEKAGYATTRRGKQITRGFTHSLGHGVGLQVHEGPALGEFNKFALEAHNVVTVEPGLYDPDIGGVRIEDIVEITKAGCNNLTKMEIQLEI